MQSFRPVVFVKLGWPELIYTQIETIADGKDSFFFSSVPQTLRELELDWKAAGKMQSKLCEKHMT